MTREKLPKNIGIFVLDQHQKDEIRARLEEVMNNMGLNEVEADHYIESGMDGALCDLENIIDIYNLETIEIEK